MTGAGLPIAVAVPERAGCELLVVDRATGVPLGWVGIGGRPRPVGLMLYASPAAVQRLGAALLVAGKKAATEDREHQTAPATEHDVDDGIADEPAGCMAR